MIRQWREEFGLGELPFVFVQLQPCGIPPDMRYAQAEALGLGATGMAACFDLGDPDPANPHGLCHSRYKPQCGRRLALQLRALWGMATVDEVVTGPTVLNASYDGRSSGDVTVTMRDGDGLHWNGTRQCTACCGTTGYPMQLLMSSGTWRYIEAKNVALSDGKVTLSGARWAPHWGPFSPVRLRYAWEDFPQCALYNSDGLPAPPFNISIRPNAVAGAAFREL